MLKVTNVNVITNKVCKKEPAVTIQLAKENREIFSVRKLYVVLVHLKYPQ
jgi:hypothetical protein